MDYLDEQVREQTLHCVGMAVVVESSSIFWNITPFSQLKVN
jgi:hypothetical protein